MKKLKAAEESERDIITRLVGKIARKRLRLRSRAAKRVPPRLGVNLAFLVERKTWMRYVSRSY